MSVNNGYALLGILQSYTNNAKEHQFCSNMYSEATMQILRDHDSSAAQAKAMEITMASAILDGLKYGNWPWSPKTVDQIDRDTPSHAVSSRMSLPTVKPGELCERYALDRVKCNNQGTHFFDGTLVPGYAGGMATLCDDHAELEQQVKDFAEAVNKLPR